MAVAGTADPAEAPDRDSGKEAPIVVESLTGVITRKGLALDIIMKVQAEDRARRISLTRKAVGRSDGYPANTSSQ